MLIGGNIRATSVSLVNLQTVAPPLPEVPSLGEGTEVVFRLKCKNIIWFSVDLFSQLLFIYGSDMKFPFFI